MSEARTPRALKNLKKVKRPFVIAFLLGKFREKSKPHRIMSISDGKSLAFPEYAPCGRHKVLGEYHWSHDKQPQQRPFVVQRLGSLPYTARIKTLKVVRSVPVSF